MFINLQSRLNVSTAITNGRYRDDIQGLRALAVLAVIAFHFGYLPHGYLGVDIFFVISGYLITGLLYNSILDDRFSIVEFYIRRTRRILPLALFISTTTLVIGAIIMLPDDMENLAESVFATNVFSNNILQAITTRNYWDIVNEYKALMHTWSLGVEEQYYLLYPFLFLALKNRRAWLPPLLAILTMASLTLYFLPDIDEYIKFYYLPFRFFELSAGGLAAIIMARRVLPNPLAFLCIVTILCVLIIGIPFASREAQLIVIVVATVGILVSSNHPDLISKLFLQNRMMVALGLISFSLYMWHQPVLVVARYLLGATTKPTWLLVSFTLITALSSASYHLIEKPFRNQKVVNLTHLTLGLGMVFFASSAAAFYIYENSGVLRDVPELDISKSNITAHMHAAYNSRIREYDKPFKSDERIKVLAVGDSFARDWANVLLESNYKEELDIVYDELAHKEDLTSRAVLADVIFWSTPVRDELRALGISEEKIKAVGTKNFGASNGSFYNYYGADYYAQRTVVTAGTLETNEAGRKEWRDSYIDIMAKLADENGTVSVFTPDKRFISQDGRHLTRAGAQYLARLFESDLVALFEPIKKKRLFARDGNVENISQ